MTKILTCVVSILKLHLNLVNNPMLTSMNLIWSYIWLTSSYQAVKPLTHRCFKIYEKVSCFPNSYRVLLNIFLTVASVETSFSKLKLLNSYLRSTISQEKLNDLEMIDFENNIFGRYREQYFGEYLLWQVGEQHRFQKYY